MQRKVPHPACLEMDLPNWAHQPLPWRFLETRDVLPCVPVCTRLPGQSINIELWELHILTSCMLSTVYGISSCPQENSKMVTGLVDGTGLKHVTTSS